MRGYNQFQYNTHRYNADGAEISLSDTVSSVDATIPKETEQTIVDFLFLSEFVKVDVTNKALSDEIKISDWIAIKQRPQSSGWFD